MQQNDATKVLIDHGIKPTLQRIAIMHYLLNHRTHPTVDDVYSDLVTMYPTLSRTTVYNTLRMFSEHSAAQMITIDEHRVSYDGDTHPHSHFICRKCGATYDLMDVQMPSIKNLPVNQGFKIDEVQLYFKGLCPHCSSSTLDDYADA